jgi:hypothetical protein
MSWEDIRGTFQQLFGIGGPKTGPNLKANGTALEARNTADSAYAIFRVADPVGAHDAVNLESLGTIIDADTSLMVGGSGQFAYLSMGGHAAPTDAWDPLQARVVGAFQGATGKIKTAGVIPDAQFTTAGGKPTIGQKVWIALSTDDGGTAYGKLSAKPPPAYSYSDANFGGPNAAIQVVAGIVLENNDYDTLKICKVLLGVVFPEDENPPKPPLVFTTGALQTSDTDYIRTPGNTAGTTWGDGETLFICFDFDAPSDDLNSNANSAVYQWGTDATLAPGIPGTNVANSPAVTLTGFSNPVGHAFVIKITTGGVLGAALFAWSSDGGQTFSAPTATGAAVALGATGITAHFAAGTYVGPTANHDGDRYFFACNNTQVRNLWSNCVGVNGSIGWAIFIIGTIFVRQLSGLGTTTMTGFIPRQGRNKLALTITGGNIRGSINGLPVEVQALANPIVPPDNTCDHQLGGPSNFLSFGPDGIIEQVAKFSRALNDAELVALTADGIPNEGFPNNALVSSDMEAFAKMQPRTPEYALRGPANAFVDSPYWDKPWGTHVLGGDVDWFWNAGTGQLVAINNAGGTRFTWTAVGAPTFALRKRAWYRDVQPFMLDTQPCRYNSNGIPVTSSLSRLAFTLPGNVQELMLGFATNDAGYNDQLVLGVYIDGTFYGFTSNGQEADSQVKRVWMRLRPSGGAPRLLEIVNTLTEQTDDQGGLSSAGAYLTELFASADITFVSSTAPNRLVILGDETQLSQDADHSFAVTGGLAVMLRRIYTNGAVTSECAAHRSIHNLLVRNNGSMLPIAHRIVQELDEGTPTPTTQVFHGCLMINDYSYDGVNTYPGWTPALYAQHLGELIDAIHALRPACAISWETGIQAAFDAVPNANGDTLAQFNAALTALTGSRAWFHVYNVRGPNALTFQANNRRLQTAGLNAYANNVRTALGI